MKFINTLLALALIAPGAMAAKNVEAKKVEATVTLPTGWTTQQSKPRSKNPVRTATVVINGKSYAPSDELPVIKDGDVVSVTGGTATLETPSGTITAGDGTGFKVNKDGVSVTAGSVTVSINGKTATVAAGQTAVIQKPAVTKSFQGTSFSEAYAATTIIVTSPKQETTNGGTTSPSSP